MWLCGLKLKWSSSPNKILWISKGVSILSEKRWIATSETTSNESGSCDKQKMMISSVNMWIEIEMIVMSKWNRLNFRRGEYSEWETLERHFGDYFNQLGSCDNQKMLISSVIIWIEVEMIVMSKWNSLNFRRGEYSEWETLNSHFGDYFNQSVLW